MEPLSPADPGARVGSPFAAVADVSTPRPWSIQRARALRTLWCENVAGIQQFDAVPYSQHGLRQLVHDEANSFEFLHSLPTEFSCPL